MLFCLILYQNNYFLKNGLFCILQRELLLKLHIHLRVSKIMERGTYSSKYLRLQLN